MSEQFTETVVGIAVVTVAALFLFYALGNVGAVSDRDTYQLHARFSSVNGISRGSDVRLSGVKVGAVTNVQLDPVSYLAQITVAIDSEVQVPDDSAIEVTSSGLLGDSFVQIIPGASLDNLLEGGEFEETQGAQSLISLLLRFATSQNAN